MIKTWKCKDTKELFLSGYNRRWQNISRVALRRINALNAAADLNDLLTPPGNQLEALKGDRKRQYSIRINQQWRICFVWRDNNAYDVEITDYHS
jgi:proteic killer suppression protein